MSGTGIASEPDVADAIVRVDSLAGTPTLLRTGSATIRFGIAGWTHRTMTARGVFYPPGTGSAERRLRHYASLFSFVEVDSTYYSVPTRENSERWVERTPPDFVFDVKAHALMTGHATEIARLPPSVRELLADSPSRQPRLRAGSLPPEAVDECWRLFIDGLEPLRSAGRLGSILLQYPPWFEPGREEARAMESAAGRLGEAGMRCAVELRNAAWFRGRVGERTIQFLGERRIPFVIVDEPQGLENSVPPVAAVTSPELAVVRFHGQRAETWDVPGATVEERFRYLYTKEELEPWAAKIAELAARAREVHVVFNNCYANLGAANALEMASLVGPLLH